MEIRPVENWKNWNEFLLENNGSFLQSSEWGQMQKENLKEVMLFRAEENNEILAQFLAIGEKLTGLRKNYLYIPFGPTFRNGLSPEKQREIVKVFFKEAGERLKEKNYIFLRIEPYFSVLPGPVALKRIQPQKTLILSLEKPEEQIFQSFHFKARYNTRVAQKRGIEISIANKENSDIGAFGDIFYEIMSKTGERQEFGIYSKKYYKKILDIYTGDFKSELFLAKFQEKFIAAYIIVYFGETAVCLHGGMDYQYRDTKAPYLLQWRQISEAKKRGLKQYDFWGSDEKKWPGLTYFKKNFRGEEVSYPGGIDLAFRKGWYLIYKLLKKFR